MSCSTATPCARSAAASCTDWLNWTLRSSSPCTSSTGERQSFTCAMGEDSYASLAASACFSGSYVGTQFSISTFQSCTPCRSTPAANRSEARARPIAVKNPPYEPPHSAMRFASLHAVADPAAVIHRQHHVAAAREILVQRVGIAVVIHVVPTQEHLPA